LRQVVITTLLLLAAFGVGGFHFVRNFQPGRLDADGMDRVQAARITARTRRFSTHIIRPLLTERLAVNGDGTAPDFAHPPLYPALAAGAMRAAHQTGPGQGDREAALVSLALFLAGGAACAGLASRLFPAARFGAGTGPLAAALYVLAGVGMTLALQPHPATLAALLFTLLLWALWGLDAVPPAGEPPRRTPPMGLAVAVGALYGLLYLTAYSVLALLPVLLFHLWRTSAGRRRPVVLLAFLLSALAVASPFLLKTWRLTHNPFYNSRLAELVMHTETFPGYGLYRLSVMPQTLSAYLSGGGVAEIARKAWGNVHALYGQLPLVVGVFLVPLWAMAALTRFTDARVNRLRTLVYLCAACHVLGLSLFVPAAESAPLLLMYAPWAAALGAAFLLTLVRARNWPAFYGRMAVWGWALVACVPGLAQLFGWGGGTEAGGPRAHPYEVWDFLNRTSPQMETLRSATRTQGAAPAYLISESPWEAAYRLDQPVVWLPEDSEVMEAVERRTGRPMGGIILTPSLYLQYQNDPTALFWKVTYNRVVSLSSVSAGLDAELRQSVVEHTRLYYPPQLSSGMRGFLPAPSAEREGADYSLLFWRPTVLSGKRTAPADGALR
jgi:hypothetical protein